MTKSDFALTMTLGMVVTILCQARASRGHDDRAQIKKRFAGVENVWASLLWSRFPKEMYGLFLSPLIKEGRIRQAQKQSRVHALDKGVESYSGYITVDERYNSNMFFWFFPAVHKVRQKAPVLLWLNGGPGRTSMVGALLENGPLTLAVENGKTKVVRRDVSWTESFSMLYIDNPVGVGYSFTSDSEGYSTTLDQISANLYSVLVQFFQMFPEYAKKDFYAGGQSFAGKYIPALGCYIHDRNNDHTPPRILINFKGIYLGAGYCDPENMMPVFYDYLYHSGVISNYTRLHLRERVIQGIHEGLNGNDTKDPWYYMRLFFSIVSEKLPKGSGDHLLGTEITNTGLLEPMKEFQTSLFARFALHVGFAQNDKAASYNPYAVRKLRHVLLPSTSSQNGFLMERYQVLHYNGNLDVVVNVPMTEAFLDHVQWSGQAEYVKHQRHKWIYKDKLAGWFVTIGNFTRVIVRNAGHMVPYDKPEQSLDMMRRFVYRNFISDKQSN